MSWWPWKPKKPAETKEPELTVHFCIAFWCEQNHLQDVQRTLDIYGLVGMAQICSQCGDVCKPAVLSVHYLTGSSTETYYFVRYLDKEPVVKLSDQAITKINEYAKRDSYASVAPENKEVYQAGLQDGVTAFSKFLKEELTEESDA